MTKGYDMEKRCDVLFGFLPRRPWIDSIRTWHNSHIDSTTDEDDDDDDDNDDDYHLLILILMLMLIYVITYDYMQLHVVICDCTWLYVNKICV